jgi:hypothetical protein
MKLFYKKIDKMKKKFFEIIFTLFIFKMKNKLFIFSCDLFLFIHLFLI